LRSFGLSDEVVTLAWPGWWSNEAESSPAARAELRFVLSRRLGLDAKALLENDEPRFVWKVAAFKNLSATSIAEQEIIVSYATSLARAALSASAGSTNSGQLAALRIREQLLISGAVVALPDVLAACWALGIPVVQLKTFPLSSKRMCAMSVKVADRYAILLAKASRFPSQVAYYVAHELGHIALSHLATVPAVIDAKDPARFRLSDDPQELAADRYALELLTGVPDPKVLTEAKRYSAAGLARAVLDAGPRLRIDPGTLALCFGHSAGRWDTVTAALKIIYPEARPVGPYVNHIAFSQMGDGASGETQEYLRAATGAT